MQCQFVSLVIDLEQKFFVHFFGATLLISKVLIFLVAIKGVRMIKKSIYAYHMRLY